MVKRFIIIIRWVNVFWNWKILGANPRKFPDVHTGYKPNCLTTFWTQLAYHFNRRTAEPLEGAPPPGCDEPTSRCQTAPSMWTIGRYKPVIPRVTFIRVRCRSHIQWTNVRTAGHLLRLSSLIGMYSSQSSWLMRIHYHFDFHPKLANLWTPPLLFRRQPPQLNYPPYTVAVDRKSVV